MKSITIASTALLLAGLGLAADLPIKFRFWDAGVEIDAVDAPYSRENFEVDGQCISHEEHSGKSADKLSWRTKDEEVLAPNSYCVYLFYGDAMCGGDVDDMFVVPAEGQTSLGYDDVPFKDNRPAHKTAKATVVRSGGCLPEKPKRVPPPSEEDMKEHNARLEAAKLVAGAIQDSS